LHSIIQNDQKMEKFDPMLGHLAKHVAQNIIVQNTDRKSFITLGPGSLARLAAEPRGTRETG
jgi:hypothetical protein